MKHCRSSYSISFSKSISIFYIVHIDVWGRTLTVSLFFKYFVTFVDDCSRVTWVYKSKGDVFSTFVSFQKMIKTQFENLIKILRSDNGGD